MFCTADLFVWLNGHKKAEDLLPEHTVKVEIEILSEKERNMKLTIPA